MALVSYSDSESESEPSTTKDQPSAHAPQNTTATSSKAGFQKVVNRTEPHKIKVSLSSLTHTGSSNDTQDGSSERPAKRTKTGGAFSDFNSLLPAPKNPSKSMSNSLQDAPGKSGSGETSSRNGVSLKTGSEPAFRREHAGVAERPENSGKAGTESATSVVKTEDIQIKGSNIMFKPLSVSKKPKKKPALPNTTSLSKPATPLEPVNKKPKKSLFSVAEDEDTTPATNHDTSEYQPMFAQEEAAEGESHIDNSYAEDNTSTAQGGTGQSLEDLANTMGLSAAERRQLFGRRGKLTDAQITQFSLAAEYAHNREMLEKQDTAPQHNPVKSIAPGKHSLQQLMKAASSNQDALEESFIRGKNNKKEAGNKYGW